MKKIWFITLLLFTLAAHSQRAKLRIAYIDMEMILDSMPEYKQAMEELNMRVVQWKAQMDRMQSEIDRLKKELEAEKLMLTKELVKEKQEIIDFKEKQLTKFQMEKFGPQGDLELQRMMILKPVQDQVFNAVQKIAQTRHYDIVFDKSDPRAGTVFINPKLNITHLVIRELKKKHRLAERNKKKEKQHKARKKNVNLQEKYEERRRRLQAEREARRKQEEEKKNDEKSQTPPSPASGGTGNQNPDKDKKTEE